MAAKADGGELALGQVQPEPLERGADGLPELDRPEADGLPEPGRPEPTGPLERDRLLLPGLPPDLRHARQLEPELPLRLGPEPPFEEVWAVAVVQVGPRGRWVTQP